MVLVIKVAQVELLDVLVVVEEVELAVLDLQAKALEQVQVVLHYQLLQFLGCLELHSFLRLHNYLQVVVVVPLDVLLRLVVGEEQLLEIIQVLHLQLHQILDQELVEDPVLVV
jgi:hypothetical protein